MRMSTRRALDRGLVWVKVQNHDPIYHQLYALRVVFWHVPRTNIADEVRLIIIPGGGGGGHSDTEGGGAPSLRISRKKGSFLRPPHVRDFVKEGYFCVPRYEVGGSKSPYNPRNIRGSDAE